MSSPLSFLTAAESLSAEKIPSRYRPAQSLPYALQNRSLVHLEAQQYLEAITLLTNVLYSCRHPVLPALVPPPQHLSLLSTLIVHPSLNTRAKTPEKRHASNEALHYLRQVNRVVGPVAANLLQAFLFPRAIQHETTRRAISSNSSDIDERIYINSPLANEGAVWSRAEDFWHIVGWAFNCSVDCEWRWQRWKLWLELMMEILEDDWNERMRLSEDSQPVHSLQQSIIMQYLPEATVSQRSGRRRIIRAILADGSPSCRAEFKEVFPNETRRRRGDCPRPKKLEKIDILEGQFGDYGDAESENDNELEEMEMDSIAGSEREDPVTGADGVKCLGGISSILLRQRILALLTRVASTLPKNFTRQDDFFDTITEYLRPISLPIFMTLLSTSTLPSREQILLNTNILLPLLLPCPLAYLEPPSLAEFAEYFLPYAANTVSTVDNAKVSLLLESTLLQMLRLNFLKPTDVFKHAVEQGIRARREKATGYVRDKDNQEEDGRSILEMSAQRIRVLLQLFYPETLETVLDMENSVLEGQASKRQEASFLASSPLSSPVSMESPPD